MSEKNLPSLGLALLPVVLTLGLLALQLFYYGDFTPHIPLVIGLAITSLLGVLRGQKWMDVREGVFHVIHVSMPSVAVLIVVGMIIGTWIASGTVPTLIYYGLTILNPSIFLAAAMILCAVVSLSLGTSWGTIGTVGLALMGIGAGFGVPVYWTAGAVVSGSFFGDKISPLSDTTNLAPAVTGTTVFDHIQNMLPTTVPAMLIALVIYLIAGFALIDSEGSSFDAITAITTELQSQFSIGLVPLLPAVVVIGLALTKNPPLPSLFAGVLAGAAVAIFWQGYGLHDVFAFAQSGYSIDTGIRRYRQPAEFRRHPVDDVDDFADPDRAWLWRCAGTDRLSGSDYQRDHFPRQQFWRGADLCHCDVLCDQHGGGRSLYQHRAAGADVCAAVSRHGLLHAKPIPRC